MALVFATAPDPQSECPFFTNIPREIRDNIFDLVLTPHRQTGVLSPKTLSYSRPGFFDQDRRLSTSLLRCCQMIYLETRDMLAKKHISVDWICRESLNNGTRNPTNSSFSDSFSEGLRRLNIITRSVFVGVRIDNILSYYIESLSTRARCLEYLKITVMHDHNPENADNVLLEDPVARKRPGSYRPDSWAFHLPEFTKLQVLELEIETLEERKDKLDLFVATAASWRFPVSEGKEMLFKPRKIRWEGWHGPSLGKRQKATSQCGSFTRWYSYEAIPGFRKDPVERKQRMIDAGVKFISSKYDTDNADDDIETYCVATLVFETTPAAEIEAKSF